MGQQLTFIFINGRPCAGKDTQADLIVEALGSSAVKISTGEIFRGAKANKGEYAKYHDALEFCVSHVDSGGLIPDKDIVAIVEKVIRDKVEGGITTLVFTGFPRTIGQLREIDRLFKDDIKHFLSFEVSEETAKSRAELRIDSDLKKGVPPRPEDMGDSFMKRQVEYSTKTLPMLKRLDMEGRLHKIDGEREIEKIRQETEGVIKGERFLTHKES
jgi:adenylate kinase family enzyme